MNKYSRGQEEKMLLFFSTLNEKEKRQYAAVESEKLGYGGQRYISKLFKISRFRVRSGQKELNNIILFSEIPVGKQRRIGGGRKKKEISEPDLIEALSSFIERHKAGSPTDPNIFWTHLKPKEIAEGFKTESCFIVSNGLVKRVLKSKGFRYRKLSKTIATGKYALRDEQFKIIFQLVALMSLDTPIISIDCKKKERLGNLYRAGKVYATGILGVYDHDYHYLGKGSVIPHGIYDMCKNKGYITIGNSHETATFIADNILWWWDKYGIDDYPDAKTILILCDSGGGNSYRHHAFKKQMLILAEKTGIDFIICHYPPYASKWNPIEHRLFCHVQKAMEGVILTDYQIVKEIISKTKTESGLKTIVRLNLKEYPIGIKTDKSELDFSRIHFNQNIPELSYRIAA